MLITSVYNFFFYYPVNTSTSLSFNFDSCFDPGADPDGLSSKVWISDGLRGGSMVLNSGGGLSVN